MTPACICVLLNPFAGGGRALALRAPLAEGIRAAAATAVAPVRLEVAESGLAAGAMVDALPNGSRVVVVGGDGSLHPLLPAIRRGGHSLALVPAGSGNDTARALGWAGVRPEKALHHALQAQATAIDLGEVRFVPEGAPPGTPETVVPFISSLTAGFDSAVGLRAIHGPRWLRGLPRYLLATLRELAALRNWPITVTVDGEAAGDGPLLFASSLNTATYAGGMPCVPHADIADGRLDLLLAGPFGRAGVLQMLPRLLMGRHLGQPRVRAIPFRQARFAAAQPVPLAAEGEPLGATRAWQIDVLPAALAVVRGPARDH